MGKREEIIGGLRDMGIAMSGPPEGWRRVAPADCIGIPAISVGYQMELAAIAQQQGLQVVEGCTLTATYEKRDGQWWPIPNTVKVQ